MKRLCLLEESRVVEDLTASPHPALDLAGYQALWHPTLLADAEAVPAVEDVNNPPSEEDAVVAVPRPVFDKAPELIQNDLKAMGNRLLVVDDCHAAIDGPQKLLESSGLCPGECTLADDFFALAYAYLAVEVLLKEMGQESSIDSWSLMTDMREAAERIGQGDHDPARDSLQMAYDAVFNARQTVYPATINWVDVALWPPGLTEKDVADRLGWTEPINILLTGRQAEELAERQPELAERLRNAQSNSEIELLGGTYDERPWPLLPHESRLWNLDRSAAAFDTCLGREPESFAARSLALTPDLPQMLMKYQYRYALHASFDGSRIPYFREPKLNWTSPDGSVAEALCRVSRNAADPRMTFAIIKELARSVMQDRSATVVLAHWFDKSSPWYYWMLRINQFASILGNFVTVSDYFLNTSIPDCSTTTRGDEYGSLATNVTSNPISRWVDFHHLRGRLDAARTLQGLHHLATGKSPSDENDLEDLVEQSSEEAAERLQQLQSRALSEISKLVLDKAPAAPGYLLFNPCSFPRRACLELDGLPDSMPVVKPLRAFQRGDRSSALVVDIPGWGFAWLPRQASAVASESSKPPALAKKRKLFNELLEVEMDPKTGGVRGIRTPRSIYSRLGQQLVYSKGSRCVCRTLKITSTGPAYGEIITSGELQSKDGNTVLATFEQTTRMWDLRPHVEISIEIQPRVELRGPPREEYIGCRWAWQDEKAVFAPANGFVLQSCRREDVEAPQLIEIRERHLITSILPHGAPFHQRISSRMADTLLLVRGETRRRFDLSVAIDLAHPWTAVYDSFWPVFAHKVEQGPPAAGPMGWLARLSTPDVMCTRLLPYEDYGSGIQMRMIETAGSTQRADVRFSKDPESARLTNCRGQLIFDLHPEKDTVQVDFSPHEMLQVEVCFSRD